LDDSKYAASIAEQLDEESKDVLSDDDMSILLYTLSVGMTSANTAKQKQDQLEQWLDQSPSQQASIPWTSTH
jgi:hypothetical protein